MLMYKMLPNHKVWDCESPWEFWIDPFPITFDSNNVMLNPTIRGMQMLENDVIQPKMPVSSGRTNR